MVDQIRESQAQVGLSEKPRIVVIDDEPSVLTLLSSVLDDSYDVAEFPSVEAVGDLVDRDCPDVIVVDKNLPGKSGIDLLEEVKAKNPECEVILITAYSSLDSAVEALRLGAFDYLAKPFSDVRIVREKIDRAVEKRKAARQQKQMQISLAQADRMASLGILAAGVAHEINNPLAFVLFNLENLAGTIPKLMAAMRACRDRLTAEIGVAEVDRFLGDLSEHASGKKLDEMQELATEAVSGAQRIRGIVQDLKVFSRVEGESRFPIKLDSVIDSAINMAYNQIKFRAKLIKEFGETPPVLGSEGRLSQVFLNLLVNAAHAIEEGEVEHNQIRVGTVLEGNEVVCEVRDTGKGIKKEDLDRVFDPFYSTKSTREGSGLGLSICQRIVNSHDGVIQVESKPGLGTRFIVRIPAYTGEDPGPETEAAVEEEQPDESVRGKVLVVDDEPLIGTTIRRILREHEVVLATSGREGMRILNEDASFDLIISDLMMPDVSGMDLYEHARAFSVDLADRFVFISGGAFTPRAIEFVASVSNIQVEKPFDPRNLRTLVRKLIQARRQGQKK